MEVYDHWSDFPAALWRWPDFSPEEMACRGTGKLAIDFDFMDKLQALRTLLGRPLIMTSAFRSKEHNATLKGAAPDSEHLKARAGDVSMINHDPVEFEAAARKVGFTGFGFYKRSNFIHIDTGRAREWGTRWAKTMAATRFSDTPIQRPESAAADQTVRGGGLTAVGLVTAAAPATAAVADLSPVAQAMAVAGVIVVVVGLVLIARDKVGEWLG
ncbi:MAG: D-Ala-D-Ala carboxypeptidase family metallohydrolase [Pseudomonadota bacterium]